MGSQKTRWTYLIKWAKTKKKSQAQIHDNEKNKPQPTKCVKGSIFRNPNARMLALHRHVFKSMIKKINESTVSKQTNKANRQSNHLTCRNQLHRVGEG